MKYTVKLNGYVNGKLNNTCSFTADADTIKIQYAKACKVLRHPNYCVCVELVNMVTGDTVQMRNYIVQEATL